MGIKIAYERRETKMFYAAKINPIVLILFLVLFMCVLILQIYLSNRKSTWPGLILLFLHAACRVRNRRKKQKMLDKMNLHDLN